MSRIWIIPKNAKKPTDNRKKLVQQMPTLDELQALVKRFETNFDYYKNSSNSYNEHSCRIEYLDPLLNLLGWDVANAKGLSPQYREVIAKNYSTPTDRPDYTLTLRGASKFFVEAKKPSVDISRIPDPANQARKYGWNANHKIAVLTNFECFIIYDTTLIHHKKMMDALLLAIESINI